MTLMSHPEHGFTHVYNDQELKERLAKGWTVVVSPLERETVPAEAREEKPKRKYTRKVA